MVGQQILNLPIGVRVPVSQPTLREQIVDLVSKGKTYKEVTTLLKCSKSTVAYHVKRAGISMKEPDLIDWTAVQLAHDTGLRFVECRKQFGFTRASWYKAIERGVLVPKDWRIPVDQLFVEGNNRNPQHLKQRAIKAGLVEEKCYSCGLGKIWNGKPLMLWLDHANGIGDDWRPDNLRMVCPNCDTQSPTFAGRNVRRT